MNELDELGFKFGSKDLLSGNVPNENGVVACPVLQDRLEAIMATVKALIEGFSVEQVYATPEGAECKIPTEMNLKLCFANGRELLITGEWTVSIGTSRPPCEIGHA